MRSFILAVACALILPLIAADQAPPAGGAASGGAVAAPPPMIARPPAQPMTPLAPASAPAAAPEPYDPALFKTWATRIGYAMGYGAVQSNRITGLDIQAFIEGAQDASQSKDAKVPVREGRDLLPRYRRMEGSRWIAQAGLPQTNAPATWLETAAKRPKTVKTASGVLIETLKEAEGPKPAAGGKVRLHYTTRLIDGMLVDSSYMRQESALVALASGTGVIPAWIEALPQIPVGGIARLHVPADQAYGARGRPQIGIPPGALLIYEVEPLGLE